MGDRIAEAAVLSLLYLHLASRPYVYRAAHSDCTAGEPRCECKAITFVGDTSPRVRPNPASALSSLSQIYGVCRPAPQFTHDDPEHTPHPDRAWALPTATS